MMSKCDKLGSGRKEGKEGGREGGKKEGRKEKGRERKGIFPFSLVCLVLEHFSLLIEHISSLPGQSIIHHCCLPLETVTRSFNSLCSVCWKLMEELSLSPILELVENQSEDITSFTIILGNKV